jgi:dTDP-4-amino-4,6-dideoxygalactose transaminase
MSRGKIRFQRPMLPSAEATERYLAAAREARWFSNAGPCWHLLRERLAAATGCVCIPVANATLGLIVAVAALLERPARTGRSALVPSFAFAASAQAPVWNGLEPVFVDVDPEHWHLAPRALEHGLSELGGDVAVVIALSSFGTPPPAAVRLEWERLCAEAGVPLLVDSAAGFGAEAADGRRIGAQGDAEVVSFHAVKPLGIGEGGAVFTRDPDLADEILRLTDFGFDESKQAARLHGLNAKLPEYAAAIALAALDEYAEALYARRAAAEHLLSRLPRGFRPQLEHERGTWQFVPLSAPSAAARGRALECAAASVEVRTYYDPLHLMPAFADCRRADDLPVTSDLGTRMLSLPMATDLTQEEIATVAAILGTE